MTPTLSSTHAAERRPARGDVDPMPRDRCHSRGGREARRERQPRGRSQPLGRYLDQQGRHREVIARPGSAGSVIVVDRDALTCGDSRLVAHLAADEPHENAALVCTHYLQDAGGVGPRCRRVTPEDATTAPFADRGRSETDPGSLPRETEPVDAAGYSYRLERVQTGMSIPELRWRRRRADEAQAESVQVSAREAIACLQSYEPVRTLTLQALACHRLAGDVSTTVLRSELERVQLSPIVLNRRLREVALATMERQELSMSEIAIRCGRVKRDSSGNESGETSWLARRLGLLPEGGQRTPTPWIHSDVLALIARRGLGVSPREVEQG